LGAVDASKEGSNEVASFFLVYTSLYHHRYLLKANQFKLSCSA
jgi:hypothetical protein